MNSAKSSCALEMFWGFDHRSCADCFRCSHCHVTLYFAHLVCSPLKQHMFKRNQGWNTKTTSYNVASAGSYDAWELLSADNNSHSPQPGISIYHRTCGWSITPIKHIFLSETEVIASKCAIPLFLAATPHPDYSQDMPTRFSQLISYQDFTPV